MAGHGGSSTGSYLTYRPYIPSHCASIVVTSTVRVNSSVFVYKLFHEDFPPIGGTNLVIQLWK